MSQVFVMRWVAGLRDLALALSIAVAIAAGSRNILAAFPFRYPFGYCRHYRPARSSGDRSDHVVRLIDRQRDLPILDIVLRGKDDADVAGNPATPRSLRPVGLLTPRATRPAEQSSYRDHR
jgi:hypothetical protein